MLKSYLYEPVLKVAAKSNTKKIISIDQQQNKLGLTKVQKKSQSQQFHSTFSQIKKLQEQSKNQSVTKIKILEILHNAIAEKQNYPESAIEFKRRGIVSIGFYVSSDGTLSQIKLIHSSGFSDIDHAAMDAVQESSPVHAVSNYLQQQEYFTVDVVFE